MLTKSVLSTTVSLNDSIKPSARGAVLRQPGTTSSESTGTQYGTALERPMVLAYCRPPVAPPGREEAKGGFKDPGFARQPFPRYSVLSESAGCTCCSSKVAVWLVREDHTRLHIVPWIPWRRPFGLKISLRGIQSVELPNSEMTAMP